jgi:hypothetical protein
MRRREKTHGQVAGKLRHETVTLDSGKILFSSTRTGLCSSSKYEHRLSHVIVKIIN